MRYNEWRDELKSNLLNVSESERRRVLDYYAEAYADRRDAGYSERQIIEDFGAPYDAAQRILLNIYNDSDDGIVDEEYSQYSDNRKNKKYAEDKNRQSNFEGRDKRQNKVQKEQPEFVDAEIVTPNNKPLPKQRKNYTWVFVLLCIIFSIPLLILVVSMAGVSVGIVVAPFALMISGLFSVAYGIYEMFGSVVNGIYSLGEGLIELGVGILLMPLMIKLVKLMWKLFNKFFSWLGSLFSGKECAK